MATPYKTICNRHDGWNNVPMPGIRGLCIASENSSHTSTIAKPNLTMAYNGHSVGIAVVSPSNCSEPARCSTRRLYAPFFHFIFAGLVVNCYSKWIIKLNGVVTTLNETHTAIDGVARSAETPSLNDRSPRSLTHRNNQSDQIDSVFLYCGLAMCVFCNIKAKSLFLAQAFLSFGRLRENSIWHFEYTGHEYNLILHKVKWVNCDGCAIALSGLVTTIILLAKWVFEFVFVSNIEAEIRRSCFGIDLAFVASLLSKRLPVHSVPKRGRTQQVQLAP